MAGWRQLFVRTTVSISLAALLAAGALAEDINQGDDPDIPEDFQGASVTAKIGSNDAWLNTVGRITQSGDFFDPSFGSGSVEADVQGAGLGVVKSKTTALVHLPGQTETHGNSCQSLKPMTFDSATLPDGATVTTNVDVHFDGLLTVKEEVGAGSTSQARVEYMAAIEQFDSSTGEREVVGSNTFDGVAWLTDVGGAGGVSINVPEDYVWMEDEGASPNSWYNNASLKILKVVASGTVTDPTTEIDVDDLPVAAAQAQAAADMALGRAVYYVAYDETFTFDAVVGETYYMAMDLQTAAGCMGGSGAASYAQSDFSNTITYTFSGTGLNLQTGVFVDGTENINSDDYFGGASSDTTLSGATLIWGNTYNLASPMTLADGTTNTFNTGAFTPTLSGALSGSGTFVKTGTGTLTMTGALDGFTGGLLISQGTLDVNNATDTSLAGSLSGSGTLLKRGAGMLTLGGNLSGFTGPVTLNQGILNVNNASNTTLASVLSGTGTFRKSGAGRLFLTGDSSGFTGSTQVQGGALAVDGLLGGDLAVASGATLGGTGTVGGNVTGAGTVAPGNSIGTLVISGDYTPSAGSTLEIEIDNTANDVLQVTGNADITAATLRAVPLERIIDDREYRFLTAAAITGPFTALDTAVLDFTTELRAGNTEYWLLVSRQGYQSVASTPNQDAVGLALDGQFATAAGDLATVMTTLDTLDTVALQGALDQMSGQIYGAFPIIARDNTAFLYGMLSDRLRSDVGALCSPSDSRSGSSQWTGWITGYGRGGAVQFDGNSPGFDYSLGGLVAVIERPLASGDRAGLFYNYGHSQLDMGGGLADNADVDSHHWGGYLQSCRSDRYLTLAGGVGYDTYDTARTIQFGAVDRTARSSHQGWQSSVYAEYGGLYGDAAARLQPFVALNYLYMYQDGLTETGADSLDLTIDGNDLNALRSILGFRVAASRTIGWLGSPDASLSTYWTHDMLHRVGASIDASLDGSPYRLRGVNAGRDWLTLDPGLAWRLGPHCTAFLDYNLAVNSQATYHTGSGGVALTW